MAIYAIGDLHLSVATEKPMDIFGGWDHYMERIVSHWTQKIKPEDTVVLAGDSSWGMSMEEAIPDFELIDSLPGRKLVLKGNHDYWWASVTSMHRILEKHDIHSIEFLHNNSYVVDGIALCGSRGWLFENGQEQDAKIVRREAIRIETSLQSVKEDVDEKILFLHYPPLYGSQEIPEYIALMKQYGVKRCYYGHIHGTGHQHAITGEHYGIEFSMISADYIDFNPVRIDEF